MKNNYTLFAFTTFTLLFISSCNKDYTCTCRNSSTGNVLSTTTLKGTQDEAKANCTNYAGGAIICTLDN